MKLFQSSIVPLLPPSYVFQHVTLRTDTQKNLLIPRTTVGLACCGASSTGDSLSNQFLKPHVRNDTSIAEFAWGEGREGDKSRSTKISFSPIFQKVLRSCTEFEEKVMAKWLVSNCSFRDNALLHREKKKSLRELHCAFCSHSKYFLDGYEDKFVPCNNVGLFF